MPKVLCKLPNASTKINGVTFVTHRDGMISEELEDVVAKQFAAIPGYEIYDPSASKKDPSKSGAPSTAAQNSSSPPPPPDKSSAPTSEPKF